MGGLLAKRPHIRKEKSDPLTGKRSDCSKKRTGNACHDHPEDTNATSSASAAGSGIVTTFWGTLTTCTSAGPAIWSLINYREQRRSVQHSKTFHAHSKTFQAMPPIFEVLTNSATWLDLLGRLLETNHQKSLARPWGTATKTLAVLRLPLPGQKKEVNAPGKGHRRRRRRKEFPTNSALRPDWLGQKEDLALVLSCRCMVAQFGDRGIMYATVVGTSSLWTLPARPMRIHCTPGQKKEVNDPGKFHSRRPDLVGSAISKKFKKVMGKKLAKILMKDSADSRPTESRRSQGPEEV